MARAFLVVMDSVGIGGAPDADKFFNDGQPDTGANTLGHIAEACASGRAEVGRSGPLAVPVMTSLGLVKSMHAASGFDAPIGHVPQIGGAAIATEVSKGKDTPSGHWELAGVPVPWDWHVFPDKTNSFPPDIVAQICAFAGTDGILGNCHASGTEVLKTFGQEHMQSGWPICYTSVDSVLQIAAHEETFGLERLLTLCKDIAPTLHKMNLGRVIARPFLGSGPEDFKRTANRKDFAIAPPAPTLCDWVADAGRSVYAVGKIGDIFSMRGIKEVRKGPDVELMRHLSDYAREAENGSLVFANFVEFDSEYGHRRDVSGYARHLEWFDKELGALIGSLQSDDLLIVTADHGNDPTWIGTDHTRERVPVLVYGKGVRDFGHVGFVDVAASVAEHLGIVPRGTGRSFI